MKKPEMRYRFSQDGRMDFLSILSYISSGLSNPEAAEKFRTDLYKSINLLLSFPNLHPVEFKIEYEYRKMIVANYLVFYVAMEDEIVIARILHSRQNFKRIFSL